MPEVTTIVGEWRRLRDGSWGVGVREPDDLTGQTVRVERRNGARQSVTLGERLAQFRLRPGRGSLPALYRVIREETPTAGATAVSNGGNGQASLTDLAAGFEDAPVEDEADRVIADRQRELVIKGELKDEYIRAFRGLANVFGLTVEVR